jgi:hypothetical protein
MAASARFATNGVEGPANLSAGQAVTLKLLSTSGVRSIAWSFIGSSDSTKAAPTITTSGIPTGATASFSLNAGPLPKGIAWIVQCVVNGGIDDNLVQRAEYSSTGIIGVELPVGVLPFAANETFERNSTFGIVDDLNSTIANITPGLANETLQVNLSTGKLQVDTGTGNLQVDI